MDDEGLCIAHVGNVRHQLERRDELASSVCAALDAKRQDGSEGVLPEILFGVGVAGVVRKRRVRHPRYVRVSLEPGSQTVGVVEWARPRSDRVSKPCTSRKEP